MTITDPRKLAPVLTADGKPWVQACYVCGRTINFIKDPPSKRVKIDYVVRHKKCHPEPIR
jgi:hypothetical protein